MSPFVPSPIRGVIEKMLQSDPERRPRNASAVLSIIKSWCLKDADPQALNLEELQYAIDSIYIQANSGRGLSEVLARLVARLGALTRSAVTEPSPANQRSLQYNLMSSFAWLCVTASFADTTLSESLDLKFGDGCPYCRLNPCECPELSLEEVVASNRRRLDLLESRGAAMYSAGRLEEYQAALNAIYKDKNSARSLDQISLCLLQSCGQVCDAAVRFVAEDRRKSLVFKLELADVAAWYFAFLTRLEEQLGLRLYGLLVQGHCPEGQWICNRCGDPSCTCEPGYEMNFVDGWTNEQP
jgi:hypothetical protein